MYNYFKSKAYVKRATYTGQKSEIVANGKSYFGFLKPVSSDDTVYNGAFGQDFHFHTYDYADIKTSDVLVIDGEEFQVKGVGKILGIVIKYKKVLVTKAK